MSALTAPRPLPLRRLLGALCALLLLGALAPAPARAAGKSLTLNLKDADITSVIATVSQMTGKNFIIDPRVKGKVTIISAHPLHARELYQVLLAVLSVHGYAAVPDKGLIKIVPAIVAKQNAVPNVSRHHPGSGDEYVTRVVAVNNVAAMQLVPVLRPLLPQAAQLAAYPGSNVLILSGGAANIQRLVEIIRRIDVADDSHIEVVPLHHASADQVVRILNSMLQADGKAHINPAEMPKLSADLRTNSVLIAGDRSHRDKLRAIIAQLDKPTAQSGNTRVFYLRYAKAKDLVPVLTGLSRTLAKDAAKGKSQSTTDALTIEADESINALVITAPPDIMSNMEQVIRRLDIRRAQVLVQAIIAEVSINKARELGVQWAFDGSNSGSAVGVVNFSGSGSGLSDIATNVAAGSTTVGDGLIAAIGDTAAGGGTRIAALLRALSGDADTNILSTPSLVTLDNQEAQIVVGQNVPFVTGSYTSTGSGSTPTNPFQTYSRQDIGLTLKIKPQINDGNSLKLDITQEDSSISSSTGGAADLITNKRSIKTSVMADSGQLIVLGGLIDNQLVQSDQRVPVLGDIPILGNLFSYKKTTKVKTNLMVFIRPQILRSPDDNIAVTGGKYDYMRRQQLATQRRGVHLMANDAVPILPKSSDDLARPPPFDPDAADGKPPAKEKSASPQAKTDAHVTDFPD